MFRDDLVPKDAVDVGLLDGDVDQQEPELVVLRHISIFYRVYRHSDILQGMPHGGIFFLVEELFLIEFFLGTYPNV